MLLASTTLQVCPFSFAEFGTALLSFVCTTKPARTSAQHSLHGMTCTGSADMQHAGWAPTKADSGLAVLKQLVCIVGVLDGDAALAEALQHGIRHLLMHKVCEQWEACRVLSRQSVFQERTWETDW